MAFEIVCCLRLNDSNTYYHLKGLALHPLVTRIWIIRSHKSLYGEIPKSEYVLTPARFKLWRWFQMMWHSIRLARRKEVRAFASFNPIPYGLIANLAARLFGKAIHFGFIGSDWYRDIKSSWGRFILPTLRKGSFFTTTGLQMRSDLIKYGFKPDKIAVLPHSVDLERYPISNPNEACYTCIFVGLLIHRKRVDLILQAFSQVRKCHTDARLCIVGDGPLAPELKRLSVSLGISDDVDFIGYKSNVQPYLANARIVIIASYMEGFPFALVEGICCGLVPVSTPVGTISHMIADGENGLLFPNGEANALADCIKRLLDDENLYQRLRQNSLHRRSDFEYKKAVAVWNQWLKSIS